MKITFEEKLNNPRFQDLEDRKFGRLIVIGFAGRINKRTLWWVKCNCENNKPFKVRAEALIGGNTKSCGCYKAERDIERNTSHDMTNSSEYRSYLHAKSRCNNPNNEQYYDYGGRGIAFKFNSFLEFYNELGNKPEPKNEYSIERIDNSGHYEKGNVKWATRYFQSRNRRDNQVITYNNKTQCLTDWSREMNINFNTLSYRLNKKWCLDCVFTKRQTRKRIKCTHIK